MQEALERVGRFTLHIFEQVGVLAILFIQTLRQLPKIQRGLTVAQMAHLGVNSLPIVSLTLLFAGMVMTLQIVDILLRYGAQSTLGGVMSIAMGRELGPIPTSSYPVSSPASSWCRSCRFTGMSSVRPEATP